ncbi:MAG: hypothetical protein H6706_02250 [Myxococcales bacterium]|nr:hypothetical protein [Myxococcales bacterium]
MTDRDRRQRFFREMADVPLNPEDPRYYPLYEDQSDVVLRLKETILFSEGESAQLLSGYRGAGKSTELRRLRSELGAEDYTVVLIDVEDYLDLHTPIDITDFLLALCGALAEKLTDEALLPESPARAALGQRLWGFVTGTIVTLKDVSLAGMKVELKSNPLFRQEVQKALGTSLGAFAREVRGFVAECVLALEAARPGTALVVLVDSVEHARGTNETEARVHESLERLFADHDDKLKLPSTHVIYTVPPWLRIRRPNIGSPYSGAGLLTLPAQKVRAYVDDGDGQPYAPGIERLVQLVGKRTDWSVVLGDRDALEELILATGGHLRDLVRVLQTVALEARTLPASADARRAALERLRAQFTPIPHEDVRWLARIARSHEAELRDLEGLGSLARYFDSHLVLCYQNGSEWYDVHPIVRDVVLDLADRLESQAAS